MINAIFAMDVNWLIGKGNLLPWRYPVDLAYFKKMTKGKTVLMGDNTYHSLKSYYKKTPLPFGEIYVANLNDATYPDAILIKDVIDFVKNYNKELWIIGGKSIYNLTLPYINTLYITHILNFHIGDVYFDSFPLSNYKVIKKDIQENLIFAVYRKE